jgi:hypothetical protein
METAELHFLGTITEYELTKHKYYEENKMETGNNSCKHSNKRLYKEMAKSIRECLKIDYQSFPININL